MLGSLFDHAEQHGRELRLELEHPLKLLVRRERVLHVLGGAHDVLDGLVGVRLGREMVGALELLGKIIFNLGFGQNAPRFLDV